MLALVNSAKGYNKQRNNLFATYAGALSATPSLGTADRSRVVIY